MFLLHSQAAAAQWQKDMTVKQLRDGCIAKVGKGSIVTHSGQLYGYRLVKVDGKTTYGVDPTSAKVVRLIFRLYVEERMGYSQIRDYLNERRVPPPSKYNDVNSPVADQWKMAVSRILKNETYATGVWTYADAAEVNIPTLVDLAVFERAQRAMSERLSHPKNLRYDYLLSGA